MSSAAYRRHVPRQWSVRVSAIFRGPGPGKGRRVGRSIYVNALTVGEARRKAIASEKSTHLTPGRWRAWSAVAKLANR